MRFKKAVILIGIFCFVSILARKTGINLFYFLSAFVLFLITANLLFFLAQLYIGRIEIHRNIGDAAIEDDILDVKLDVKNRGLIPKYYLLLQDIFSPGFGEDKKRRLLLEKIKGKQEIAITYEGRCFKRGLYRIGPVTVFFSDPMGVFCKSKKYDLYSQLIVYPKIFRIHRFPSLVKGNISLIGIGTRRASGDEFEFFGIREYKPGDPIKRIHWRSTARLRTLAVKEYEQYAAYSVTIVLDLMRSSNIGRGKETTLEYAIKIAASCAKYLIDRGVLVQLIAHGVGPVVFPFNKGEFHLQEILKFLATAEAEGGVSLSELLTVNSDFIPIYSTVILIMNDTDSDVLVNIAELKARDISVIPIILLTSTFLYLEKPEVVKSQKMKLLANLEVDSFFISRGDNLEDKFAESIK